MEVHLMPPVVAAVAANYVLGAAVSYGLISLGSAVFLVASYAVGQYQAAKARKAAKEAYNNSLTDRLVMESTVSQARSRCYGRVRNVDGILFKATHGDKKQYYTLVIALVGHEIDGVEQVYFGDTPVALDPYGWVLTTPWNGSTTSTGSVSIPAGATTATLPDVPDAGSVSVVAHTPDGDVIIAAGADIDDIDFGGGMIGFARTVIYQSTNSTSKARVRVYNGSESQDLSTELAADLPDLITAGDQRFAGIACMRVDLTYDQDAFTAGVPNPISATFRAARVYDPRTGLTQWTENPALIARDWSLYAHGGACEADDIIEQDLITAANACDVRHVFSSVDDEGITVNTERALYACGIVCSTEANPSDTLAAICESMAGEYAWVGGQLSIRAGVYSAPVGTITADWLSDKGSIEMVKDAARSDLVNVITPTISNAADAYVAGPIPRIPAAAYIADDGEEYPAELTYEGVTDADHAAHIAGVSMRDARSARTYKLPVNLLGLQCKMFETWTVNIPEVGLANVPMRIVAWSLNFEQAYVWLTLKETSATIFDPAATFERDNPLKNNSLPNVYDVPDLGALTLDSGTNQLLRQADGTIVSRLLVQWPAVQDEAVRNGGSIELRYGPFGTSPANWQTIEAPGTDTQIHILGVQDGKVYAVSGRARNKLVAGAWSKLALEVITGKTAIPVDVQGFALAVIPGALRGTRTPSTEADYASTLYRVGANPDVATAVPGTSDALGFTWPWPSLGAKTIWAADVDTSGNVGGWVSQTVTVGTDLLIGASGIDAPAEWLNSNVSLQSLGQQTWSVVAVGASNTATPPAASGTHYNGQHLNGSTRSYNMSRISRATGQIAWGPQTYDVYGGGANTSGRNAATLATDLNATTSDFIVVVWTDDEPQNNRMSGGLPAAMYRCGASAAVFGSPAFRYRSAYILVGIPGCGAGNGAEAYQGAVDSDANAWCQLAFSVVNGVITGASVGHTPSSLQDYGYTGDLNATYGATAADLAAAAADATAKANAAHDAAVAAAAAQAALAETAAKAYADGQVDAEEARAIADATTKANAAQAAAVAAASAAGFTGTQQLAVGATFDDGHAWVVGPITTVGDVLSFPVVPSVDSVLKLTLTLDGTITSTSIS